jgi:carbonic anhydrase/acetyltransferase-like protein (isoleucine patch superfamily)
MKRFFKFIIIPFLFSFFLLTGQLAYGQTNIAQSADSVKTSYVSTWEKLNAINDGIEPTSSTDKQGAAYGNWGKNVSWQWVEYDWTKLQLINKSEIYWWTDGGGIQIPSECYLEYYDIITKNWVEIDGSRGAGLKDQYHSVSFPVVLTNKIRVNMISTIATGILEWKVWGETGEQVPLNSFVSIDKNIESGSTSTVTLMAFDEANNPVENYVFKVDAIVKNFLSATNEEYVIAGQTISSSVEGFSLPATDSIGKTTFEITLPATIDPKDGIAVTPKFNNGIVGLNVAYSYVQPGKTSPTLTADNSANTVDNDIEITYADDEAWRNAISKILVNGTELTSGTDYEVSVGKLTLKPSGKNSTLTLSGDKDIAVEATGYESSSVAQTILVGAPDVAQSMVVTKNMLFKAVSTYMVVTVKDQFGNLVTDADLTYDIDVINNTSTTAETYIVGDDEVIADVKDVKITATDTNGQVAIAIEIPSTVDLYDGIKITFKFEDGTQLVPTVEYIANSKEKSIVLQAGVKSQPDFSWERTAQSENFIIYWGQKIKGDPTDKTANPSTWFSPNDILTWLEEIHSYLADTIGFLHKNDGNAAKYKYEIVMNNTWENDVFTGWAFGGIADNKIGGIWIDAGATRDNGVLSHEFTHASQGMVKIDHPGYGIDASWGGFFWESHANWMRAMYNKDHSGLLDRYINTSMMHFSVTRRHYQNFAFLDYIADKYGIQTTNDIWHKANAKVSHPLTSLRDSVLRYSQDDLNDDLAMCAMKNVTWDYSFQKDIKKVISNLDPSSIGREYTILDSLKDGSGKYIVPEYLAPADYGYNIVPLYLNDGASEIKVNFEVLENEEAGGAGSRYGFVAVDTDGKARYSKIYSEQDYSTTFTVQPTDSKFYMVVTGAPKNHHNYEWEVGYPKTYRYPYVVSFEGAIPAGHKVGYNSQKNKVAGAPHSNGGGWVASTAKVDASVYIGPNAQVLKTAVVNGKVRIEDYAIVTDNAKVSGDAIVRNHAIVGGSTALNGTAVVEKTARAYNSTIKNSVVVTGSALLYNSTLSGNVVAKDLAYLSGVTLSGTVIIGGDAEEYTGCKAGTYLEIKRLGSCDGVVGHKYDIDVNPAWVEYTYPVGEKPTAPVDLEYSNVTTTTADLNWNASEDNGTNVEYYVIQDDKVVATVTGLTYTAEGLSVDKTYIFKIQAKDNAGNTSVYSNEVSVMTLTTSSKLTFTKDDVSVFPNPFSDILTIKLSKKMDATVKIQDIQGRVILNETFSSQTKVSRSKLGNCGIYLVVIQAGNNKIVKELLVK